MKSMAKSASKYQIEIINRQRRYKLASAELRQFAYVVLASMELLPTQVSLVFVGDPRMRQLNRDYRAIDKPTDVLSFSYNDGVDLDPDGDHYLGDVVISPQTAAKYAEELGLTFEQELKYLILHGILHLCGYDHETDNGEMVQLEQRLRERLLADNPKSQSLYQDIALPNQGLI